MKRILVETGQDILIILANHLILIGFGMTVMGLFNQNDNQLLLWSGLLLIPMVMYLLRVRIKNFFLFFLLHLAIPAGILFMPLWILPKIIAFAIVLLYTIWSISIRLKEKTNGENILSPIFVIGALGGMTLIENMHSKKGWEAIYIYLAILYVAGYCVHLYISRYLNFLVVNESSAANIPEKEIFSSGIKQTIVFMVGGVFVLFLTANVGWLAYLMSGLGNVLLMILRFLFSGISHEEPEEIIEETRPEQGDMMGGLFEDPGDPALIWVILEKIVMVAAAAFLIFLVVFLLVKGFMYLWDHFHDTSVQEDKKIQTGVDVREACGIEKQTRETGRLFSFLNNREKIRRYYRKQVSKKKEYIIGDRDVEMLAYMTAKECCDKLAAENLKKIYEKSTSKKGLSPLWTISSSL